jgi:hypothetical protein
MVTGVAALSMGTSSDGAIRAFGTGGAAVVFGAGGGTGGALLTRLRTGGQYRDVTGFGRRSDPGIELQDEASLERAAAMARV